MNGKKRVKILWIIIGVSILLSIIGIFTMFANLDLGVAFVFIGLVGGILCLCCLLIEVMKKNALIFLGSFAGVTLPVISAVILTIVFDLEVWVGMIIGVIIAIIIGGAFLTIKGIIDDLKCPKCAQKFSMREISRETVATYATTIDVERTVRNNRNEIIRRYTEAVPATKYVYLCVEECKHCGYTRKVNKEKTKRD